MRSASFRRFCSALPLLLAALSLFSGPTRPPRDPSGQRTSLLSESLWVRSYGGPADDLGSYFEIAPDGDIVLSGTTRSYGEGERDLFLARLDPEGRPRWGRTYGTSGDETGVIMPMDQGGYVASGRAMDGLGSETFFLARIDDTGEILWQKNYGGAHDGFTTTARCADGGFLVLGRTFSTADWSSTLKMLRLDSSGNITWQKHFDSPRLLSGSAFELEDGTLMVHGFLQNLFTGDSDSWLMRLDDDGTAIWCKTYGGDGMDSAAAFPQQTDDGILLSGLTTSFGASGTDIWVLKVDLDGSILWQKRYAGTGIDYGFAMPSPESGGILLGGWTDSYGTGDDDSWAALLDGSGTPLWQVRIGGDEDDRLFFYPFSGQGALGAGETWSLGSFESHPAILLLDGSGSLEWARGGTGPGRMFSSTMSGEGWLALGSSTAYGSGGEDAFLLRLDAQGNLGPSCSFLDDPGWTLQSMALSVADTSAAVDVPDLAVSDSSYSWAPSAVVRHDVDLETLDLCDATPRLAAHAAADPTQGDAPLSVQFQGEGAYGSPPYTYTWDFGDGGSASTAQNPSHLYDTSGTYLAVLTVGDAASDTAEAEPVEIEVGLPCVLTCSASAEPAAGTAPLAVGFDLGLTAQNCGGGPAVEWDFGDGATGSGLNSTHTYDDPGEYHWTVTAIQDGASCTDGGTVEVSPPCTLTCGATVPAAGQVAESIGFHGEADAQNCSGSVAFEWDFGDGRTAAGPDITHTYIEEGTFTWTLTASVDGTTCTETGGIVIELPGGCVLACEASAPPAAEVGDTVAFGGTANAYGCSGTVSFLWVFGDGSASTLEDPGHVYMSPGTFGWSMTAAVEDQECVRTGTIEVDLGAGCVLACSATAPAVVIAGDVAPFTAEVTSYNCTEPVSYLWDFGDGGTSPLQNPGHPYAAPGSYSWTLTASADGESCQASGTISVESAGGCLTVGSLEICAESLVQDGSTTTLSGNVRINGILWFTGAVLYTSQSPTEGVLATEGDLYVPGTAKGDTTVMEGPGLSYGVDGTAGTLTPAVEGLTYALALSGLPLLAWDTPIRVEPSRVILEPYVYLGTSGFALAEAQLTLSLAPGAPTTLLDAQITAASLTPGINVASIEVSYDPDTDLLEGSCGVGLPFMDVASVSATIRIQAGCFNGFDITVGLPAGIPLGQSGFEIVGFTLKVDDICHPPSFYIFIGGDVGIVGVPGEILVLQEMGLGYQVPFTLEISGGTMTVLGYATGGLGGSLTVYPPAASFNAWSNLADIYQTDLTLVLDVSQLVFSGSAEGTLQIPNWGCGRFDFFCKAVRAFVRGILDGLPYDLAGVTMSVNLEADAEASWTGDIRGMIQVGGVSLAAALRLEGTELHLYVGDSFDDLYQIFRSIERVCGDRASERNLLLPEQTEWVLFAVASTEGDPPALPAAYLVTPGGATITPDNAGSHPEVTVITDDEAGIVLFQVNGAAAGTWALGQDNLEPADAEFLALCPHAPPRITFDSAVVSGAGVDLEATVEPSDENTKVAFFYTSEPSHAGGLLAAGDLNARKGNVTARWGTASVPDGTYYLFVKADDGRNAPAIAYHNDPVVVDNLGIDPPDGLSGNRDGQEAALTWTPSSDPLVAGYEVRFTDEPDSPGYRCRRTAAHDDRTVISGLDPARAYRFCVAAFDGQGRSSIESAALTLPPVPTLPGDCNGDGSVSIGEVQHAINMFLGVEPPGCGVDGNTDGSVSIGELQQVINAFITG